MKRKNFLRTIGAVSGALISSPMLAASQVSGKRSVCTLIPSETAGPFPLDLSDNTFYFRQDITEDRVGTPMLQRIRIVGTENCAPMPNLRVNIWCCDNEGRYSGYGAETGLTYMRGYQITDDNGEVEFITIFPGWYPGRVVHMHFQVHVSTSYSAVSQYTWPHDKAVEIANAAPTLYPDGPDPMIPESDGAFIDGYEHQLASCDWDEASSSYISIIEVAVEGTGVIGVGYLENQAAKVFSLGPNSPNPVRNITEVPLELFHDAGVEISLWHMSGLKVYEKSLGTLTSGTHKIPLVLNEMGLSTGSYIYQIAVKYEGKVHHDFKQLIFI